MSPRGQSRREGAESRPHPPRKRRERFSGRRCPRRAGSSRFRTSPCRRAQTAPSRTPPARPAEPAALRGPHRGGIRAPQPRAGKPGHRSETHAPVPRSLSPRSGPRCRLLTCPSAPRPAEGPVPAQAAAPPRALRSARRRRYGNCAPRPTIEKAARAAAIQRRAARPRTARPPAARRSPWRPQAAERGLVTEGPRVRDPGRAAGTGDGRAV